MTGNYKNNGFKSEIVNIEVSRIFIKKVFTSKSKFNSNKTTEENKTVILQVSNDKAVFIDSKFVKTDNFTILANIGIVLDFEYSLISLNDRNQKPEKITGKNLINLINIFSEELNS